MDRAKPTQLSDLSNAKDRKNPCNEIPLIKVKNWLFEKIARALGGSMNLTSI